MHEQLPDAGADASFRVLEAYLRARAEFTDDEMAFVRTMFVPRTLRSGEFLQRAGSVATHAAFVASGCLRSYVIDPRGKEHIAMFAAETWWIQDHVSLSSGAPSEYFIDAIEDSNVLLLDMKGHQALVERLPGYSAAFQRGLQKHAAAKDTRIIKSMSASAEERYLQFLETYPALASRVPQFMLASYLGLSPETVSRIRRKLARQ